MSGERLLDDAVLALVGESVNHVRIIREQHAYAADPESRVVRDLERVGQDLGPFESLCFLAYEISDVQLAAAEDHMQALAAMLQQGRTVVAPFVVARAAIEASARAAFILDPSLPDVERAALVMAERLNELKQVRRLIRAHDPEGTSQRAHDDLREVDRGLVDLSNFAAQHGINVPSRPGFTKVVRKALSLDGEDESFSVVAIAAYSAVAHAVPDMLLTYTVDRTNPEWSPFEIGQIGLEEELMLDSVVAVLLTHKQAAKLQIEAYGWSPGAWKDWLDHARLVLSEALARIRPNASDSLSPPLSKNTRAASDSGIDSDSSVPVHPAMREMVEQQREALREKFGRYPELDDPLFFNPDADEPEPYPMSEDEYVEQLIRLVGQIGELTPAREYAIRRCGFVASTYTWPYFSEERRREWVQAIEEYCQREGLPLVDAEEELVLLPSPPETHL